MNIAFVLENVMGHVTHAQQLKRVVKGRPDITPLYLDLTYDMADSHWIFKVPKIGPLLHLSWALRCGLNTKRRLAPHHNDFEVAYFHTQVTASASLRLMKKRPCVVSLDAAPYTQTYYEPWDSEEKRMRKRRYYKRIFTACAHLITWSQWAKNNLENAYGIASEKITVIAPGIDTQQFRPAEKNAVTNATGSTPDTRGGDGIVRVLFVGGEFHRKGGSLLTRWAGSTPHRNRELHIVTRDKLSARRRALPNVFVHNNLQSGSEELIALYQKCDIFALPTREENFGIVAIEALATGLPVVITDVNATSEIVRDGQTGFLVAPKNRAAFCARLEELVSDASLRARMSAAARKDALARFDADKNYGQLLDLLKAQKVESAKK
jgi:glycosyltransferase involved in cell wall biosynthesis